MMTHLQKGVSAMAGLAVMLLAMNHAAAQNGGSESPYFHKAGATEI